MSEKIFYRQKWSRYLGELRPIHDIYIVNVLPTPSVTPTFTPTPSVTATNTPTVTPTFTPTSTNTPSPTNTPGLCRSYTASKIPTFLSQSYIDYTDCYGNYHLEFLENPPNEFPEQITFCAIAGSLSFPPTEIDVVDNGICVPPTQTPTPTQTQTQTPTNTSSPTQTPTNTSTPTQTPTNTSTPTQTPTQTQTQTPSQTATQTVTPSNTATPTQTQTPSQTPTNTNTPSNTTTQTPTQTQTPSPSPLVSGCCFSVTGLTAWGTTTAETTNTLVEIDFFSDGSLFVATSQPGYRFNGQVMANMNRILSCGGLSSLTQLASHCSDVRPGVTEVYQMAEQSNGKYIYKSGKNISRVNSNFTEDYTFNPLIINASNQDLINGIYVNNVDQIYFTGRFNGFSGTTITNCSGGTSANTGFNMYRLQSGGTIDNTFTPYVINGVTGAGAGEPKFSTEKDPNGKVLLFTFTGITGNTSWAPLTRIGNDGLPDSTFNNSAFSAISYTTITGTFCQSNGKYLVFGSFTNVGGIAAQKYIVRLNSDGTLDTSFAYLGTILAVRDAEADGNGNYHIIGTTKYEKISSTGSVIYTRTWLAGNAWSLGVNNGDVYIGGSSAMYLTSGDTYNNFFKYDINGNLNMCSYTPVTPTPTPTNTATPTVTPSNTASNTPTPSITASQTPSVTPTNTSTPTQTSTQTQTPSVTPTNTNTQTPTPSITASNTATQTPTPSITSSQTPSVTPTNTSTPTQTSTQTQTPTQTPSPTQTPFNVNWTLSLSSSTITGLCSLPISTTYYSQLASGSSPNLGEKMYYDAQLTQPVSAGWYAWRFDSTRVDAFQTNSSGTFIQRIINYEPSYCGVSPTPSNTMTQTPTPSVTHTATPTNTITPTITPTKTGDTFYYATEYLNCVQNSSPGAFILAVPPNLVGYSWYCDGDNYQYQITGAATGPTSDRYAVSGAFSCGTLGC